MNAIVKLYSDKSGEIFRFLNHFQKKPLEKIENHLLWQKEYENPIEIAEIIGTFIDNSDDFNIYILVCLDKNVFIQINQNNADDFIKYLYERFPY